MLIMNHGRTIGDNFQICCHTIKKWENNESKKTRSIIVVFKFAEVATMWKIVNCFAHSVWGKQEIIYLSCKINMMRKSLKFTEY